MLLFEQSYDAQSSMLKEDIICYRIADWPYMRNNLLLLCE